MVRAYGAGDLLFHVRGHWCVVPAFVPRHYRRGHENEARDPIRTKNIPFGMGGGRAGRPCGSALEEERRVMLTILKRVFGAPKRDPGQKPQEAEKKRSDAQEGKRGAITRTQIDQLSDYLFLRYSRIQKGELFCVEGHPPTKPTGIMQVGVLCTTPKNSHSEDDQGQNGQFSPILCFRK